MNEKKLNIKIKNYKSLIDLEISINKKSNNRLIAIVGENNVGKTSLLEIIDKLSKNPQFSKNDKTMFLKQESSELEPSIDLEFLFEEENSSHKIGVNIHNNVYKTNLFHKKDIDKLENQLENLFTQLEETKYKEQGAFLPYKHIFLNPYQYESFKNAVNKTGDENAINIVNKIKKLYDERTMKDSNKLKINFIQNKLNLFTFTELDLNLKFEKLENLSSDEVNQKIVLENWEEILGVDFKNFLDEKSNRGETSTIRDKQKYIENMEHKINKQINSITKFIDNLNDNKKHNYKFEMKILDEKLIIKLNDENILNSNEKMVWDENPKNSGDGIKHFYSIILKLHIIRKNEFSITLFDEPEKNLNIIYQNKLLEYFKNFSQSRDRINQIIIYATHSPFMIDMELYQNIVYLEREKTTNSTIIRNIYDTKNKSIPNGLLDKNLELMFIEANLLKIKAKQVIFVEGISDFNVFSNLINNDPSIFIIPLFGNEYKKVVYYHLPYIESFTSDYKLIVDNDKTGKSIINWFEKNTNIKNKNIKKISDFGSKNENNLEDLILKPWFNENKEHIITNDKKINSLIFKHNNNKEFKKIKEFILS